MAVAVAETVNLAINRYHSRFLASCIDVNGPDFSKSSLIPAIAQETGSGKVLMLGYMNEEAFEETLSTGRVCYFSRSRNRLWRKGETSGHTQNLRRAFYDCDADAILLEIEQVGGAACHEGYKSCFFREIDQTTRSVRIVEERVFDPDSVYGS